MSFGEGLDYKGRNALFIYTRCNAGFPGLSSQAPEASDENQLSQLGFGPYRLAEPDINISFPGFAGLCVFPSSDDKLRWFPVTSGIFLQTGEVNLSDEPGPQLIFLC